MWAPNTYMILSGSHLIICFDILVIQKTYLWDSLHCIPVFVFKND